MSLSFEVSLEKVPFTVRDNGQVREYVLIEMDGEQRDKYLANVSQRSTVVGDKHVIRKFEGLQAETLAQNIHDASGQPIPITAIQKWPGRVVQELYDKLREISHLDQKAEAKEKNASEATS